MGLGDCSQAQDSGHIAGLLWQRLSATPLGTGPCSTTVSLGSMPSCSISAIFLHSHQKMEVVVLAASCCSLLSPNFMRCV